jgi:hypothetical protein
LLKNPWLFRYLIAMSAKLKKSVVMLTMATVLLGLASANMKVAFSTASGGKIDLFTQKEPYSGRGPNMPSDAFGPGNIVILYALVTYNEFPVQNLIVTFYVESPDNSSFCFTAITNSSGIATVDFTIPQESANESEFFGNWLALAKASINGEVVQDSLTFKVDWLVKLISVRAIDENLTDRTIFGKGGYVGLEIGFRSVATSVQNTTLEIVVQDNLSVPVSSLGIRDFAVQPNEKLVLLYCKLYIPTWAFVGTATVSISALTAPVNQGGVAYCPPISTNFFLVPYEPLTMTFHDAAVVGASPSSESVQVGQYVSINVLVQNRGTEAESFNVSVYCDNVSIGTQEVMALAPYSQANLSFPLDTSLLGVGNYTITVHIPDLVNEADMTDKTLVDGTIEILPKLLVPEYYFLEVKTEPAGIVTIPGEGWYEEHANVTLTAPDFVTVPSGASYNFTYWDINGESRGTGVNSIVVFMDTNHTATAHYSLVYTLTITTTAGGTTVPTPGTYNYTANSTVQVTATPGPNYVFDHWELDGVGAGTANPYSVHMDADHTLKAFFSQVPAGWFVPSWFYWSLLPILIVIIILLIIWLYRRKRGNKAEAAFYSGWTAWYYCYDLRRKIRTV